MAKKKVPEHLKYGFVYIWRDRKRKMFYIGSHWGTVDDGYDCSPSERMRSAIRRRPQDFKRRILETNINDRKLTRDREYAWLQLILDEWLGTKYYNKNKDRWEHWSESRKEEVAQKIKDSPLRRQRISDAHKGRKVSEETKQKIRIARSKQVITDETKEKIRQANYKREYGDAFKETMRQVALKRSPDYLIAFHSAPNKRRTGQPHTEETKRIMAEKARRIVSCPHCGKSGALSPIKRWHFDNCKLRPIM
jgi:hypothetical protein